MTKLPGNQGVLQGKKASVDVIHFKDTLNLVLYLLDCFKMQINHLAKSISFAA